MTTMTQPDEGRDERGSQHGGRRPGSGRPIATVNGGSQEAKLLRLIAGYRNLQNLTAGGDVEEWTPQRVVDDLIKVEAERISESDARRRCSAYVN